MVGTRKAASAWALVEADARRRPAAMVGLIATAALALSTIVAATAVSIGIARADTFAIMATDQVSGTTVAVARARTWRRDMIGGDFIGR